MARWRNGSSMALDLVGVTREDGSGVHLGPGDEFDYDFGPSGPGNANLVPVASASDTPTDTPPPTEPVLLAPDPPTV